MKPAVHFDGQTESSQSFFDRYQKAASALLQLGVGLGDVVAFMLYNEAVQLEIVLGARWFGARWYAVNWHFKSMEAHHILTDSGAKLLVVHAELWEQIRSGIPPGLRVFIVGPCQRARTAFGLNEASLNEAQALESWEAFRDGQSLYAVAVSRLRENPSRHRMRASPGFTLDSSNEPDAFRSSPLTSSSLRKSHATTAVLLCSNPGCLLSLREWSAAMPSL